jgi:hypothetical protein
MLLGWWDESDVDEVLARASRAAAEVHVSAGSF